MGTMSKRKPYDPVLDIARRPDTLFPQAILVLRRDERRRPFGWPLCTTNCADCGIGCLTIDEYPYMVHDHVWDQAWHGRRKSWYSRPDCQQIGLEVLCIGCLERRLGRTLVADDFIPDVPCNDPQQRHISQRLRDRLTATISRRLRGRPKGRAKNKIRKSAAIDSGASQPQGVAL
jgi:hypothetical protein